MIAFSFDIFQMDDSAYLFCSYENAIKSGNKLVISDYKNIYSGTINKEGRSIEQILEEIYTIFNIAHPKDYKGRSLSVSDVVAIRYDAEVSYYYVDSFGFAELDGFLGKEISK